MKAVTITLILQATSILICFSQVVKIPERTLEQKHNRTVTLTYAGILGGMAAAKNAGMTPAEYASYKGDIFKKTWNKEGGFSSFVNGVIANFETLRRTEEPEIIVLKDSSNEVVFRWKINFDTFFNNGTRFNVTYKDMKTWFDIVNKKIGEYMGFHYHQEEVDQQWLQVTITKSIDNGL